MNILQNNTICIVAELSANHGQKFEVAKNTIYAAKRAGANAIKLQTYTPDTMTIDCNNDFFKNVLKNSIWEGRTLYDLYKEAFTPWDWHAELFKIAYDEGMLCFSTPFDKTAVDFLEKFNPPAYKIASFEIKDIPFIEYVASKNRTVIISTGIAELEDIELAIHTCRKVGNNKIILLKCTSAYPALIEDSNLATLVDLKKRFGVEVGLSDHTLGIISPIVAVTLGARIIEKHFILDKTIGGPDASFSLDEKEFAEMVKAIHQAKKSIGKASYELTKNAKESNKFSRSLFVVKDIQIGEEFTEENLKSIRPGYGLHPKFYYEVLGKKSSVYISRGTPLLQSMICQE